MWVENKGKAQTLSSSPSKVKAPGRQWADYLICPACSLLLFFLPCKLYFSHSEMYVAAAWTEVLTSLALLNQWFINLHDEVADSHFALQAACVWGWIPCVCKQSLFLDLCTTLSPAAQPQLQRKIFILLFMHRGNSLTKAKHENTRNKWPKRFPRRPVEQNPLSLALFYPLLDFIKKDRKKEGWGKVLVSWRKPKVRGSENMTSEEWLNGLGLTSPK